MINERAYAIEGIDGGGKHTLFQKIVETLLANGEKVMTTDFPQYWFLGGLIKRMLHGEGAEYLNTLHPQRLLEVRAAMFSLDRTFALSMINALQEQHPEAIIVSDRSHLSNVITSAYVLEEHQELDLSADFIKDLCLTLDQELQEVLGFDIVLCTTEEDSTLGYHNREQVDQYERREVQEIADSVYRDIIPAEKHITTKSGGEWVNIRELTIQALTSLGYELDPWNQEYDTKVKAAENIENLITVGPKVGWAIFFPNLEQPAELTELIHLWEQVILSPESSVLEQFPGFSSMKDVITEIELNILDFFMEAAYSYSFSNKNISPLTITAVDRLLRSYPELVQFISILAGDDYKGILNMIQGIGSRKYSES